LGPKAKKDSEKGRKATRSVLSTAVEVLEATARALSTTHDGRSRDSHSVRHNNGSTRAPRETDMCISTRESASISPLWDRYFHCAETLNKAAQAGFRHAIAPLSSRSHKRRTGPTRVVRPRLGTRRSRTLAMGAQHAQATTLRRVYILSQVTKFEYILFQMIGIYYLLEFVGIRRLERERH
jgi:hypothetical protein